MCELAQGCSPLLLPLAARRCCCLELAAAAARRSAAAAEASALGAGAVGVGGCAQLRWSATGAVRFLGAAACEAAARSCAGRRPVCGPFPRRCCLRSGCAQLRWSATGMRSVSSALLLAKRQQHLEACRCCSLLGFSPRLRPGRKTKDASRSVTCAAACLGCESMWRCSGLMPRAALCLEGHWVKMRPGAAVMAHPRRRMAVGCHRPRAQRGTSCCAVTGASSAALRGGKMLRLLAFFPRTPPAEDIPAFHYPAVAFLVKQLM
jgi:hypothetical protein